MAAAAHARADCAASDAQPTRVRSAPRERSSTRPSAARHEDATRLGLSAPSQPLPPALRAAAQRSYGADFSRVRVHTGAAAVAANLSLASRAFTFGEHVVWGRTSHEMRRPAGHYVLSHELAHVLQQRRGGTAPAGPPSASDAGEREADRAALRAQAGLPSPVRRGAPLAVQRFANCRHILDATEGRVVRESDVQAEIFRVLPGPTKEREFPIPAGSFAPYRDPRPAPPRPGSRAGTGAADLARMSGGVMEVAEVKRGEWPLITDGERQLRNYVAKGSADKAFLTDRWHQRGHPGVAVQSVVPMPMNRVALRQLTVRGSPVDTAWCRSGLIAFKNVGRYGSNTFVCGTDAEAMNRALDQFISTLEAAVDRHIDSVVEPRLDEAIQSMPIRRALVYLARSETARAWIEDVLPGGGYLLDQLDVETIAEQVERLLQRYDSTIRVVVQMLKDEVIAQLRTMLKKMLRQWARATLNALCVGATAVALEKLIEELKRQLPTMVADAMPAAILAAVAVVVKALAEAVTEVLKWIAIVAGIIVCAIVLWEVAAAIVAGGAIEAFISAVIAALGRLVSLIPVFA